MQVKPIRMSAQFLKSAVLVKDYPPADRPEVALVGRSNAGKSSLFNALAGGKPAKVSGTPGKTRLLNFFNFGAYYRFVDMPGYGFAARNPDEIVIWQKMVKDYFESRENLMGVVLIMDARRSWQGEEQWIREWCEKLDLQWILVMNKSDKLSKNEQVKALNQMRKSLPPVSLHMVSSLKKIGIKELEEDIFQRLVKRSLKHEVPT